MKIIEKKCPNCGGNLDFKVGERDVVCKSCRRKYAVQYDGIDDLSQLSEKAMEALEAADISLKPVRKFIIILVLVFFSLAAISATISVVTMVNRRAEFDRKVKESEEEFDRRTQEMLDEVRR